MNKWLVLLIILILIISVFLFYPKYEMHLFRSRGYGLLLHPDVPGLRASDILWAVTTDLEQVRDSGDDTRQVYDPVNLAIVSEPTIIDRKIVKLSSNGESEGIYLYQSKATKLQFLAGSETEFAYSTNLFKVLVCSYGVNKKSSGKYFAYHDYPEKIQKRFDIKEWQKWAVLLVNDDYVFLSADRIFSHTPPIPGCLVLRDSKNRSKSKIYYLESILPAFHVIYPDVNIPEEQILRGK